MKIICPYHDDTKPSMEVYGEWGHCFVCGAHVKSDLLNLPLSAQEIREKREPTNIPNMLKYINGLPKQAIRGLNLHANDTGYYIVWPNGSYYKKRKYDESLGRYSAPRGVKPPLFVYPGSSDLLVVVEGELNAISLHNAVYGEAKICSPGPSSEFPRFIKYYLEFNHVLLIVDKDAPGVVYGALTRDLLLKHKRRVSLVAVEKDFNEVLQEQGESGIRKEFQDIVLMYGLSRLGGQPQNV